MLYTWHCKSMLIISKFFEYVSTNTEQSLLLEQVRLNQTGLKELLISSF